MRYEEAKEVVEEIQNKIPWLHFSGAFSRGENKIEDFDIITNRDLFDVLVDFQENFRCILKIRVHMLVSILMMCKYGQIQIDIWGANNKYDYKFLRWMRGMEKNKATFYRLKAKEKGLILKDFGLYEKATDKEIDFETLAEMKEFLKR